MLFARDLDKNVWLILDHRPKRHNHYLGKLEDGIIAECYVL